MVNKKVKVNAYTLVLGIIMFALLSISTVFRGDLLEDFMHFQIFRNQIKANGALIIEDAELQKWQQKSVINNVVDELDLTMYVIKDSLFLNFYRSVSSDTDRALRKIESNWADVSDYFLNSSKLSAEDIRKSLIIILHESELINKNFVSIENTTRILYIIILTVNLIIFVILLIFVFYITNIKNRASSGGVMSVRNALIQGQEQERLRISLELHDKVAQDLFASRMIINDLATSAETDELKSDIKKSISLLDVSIKEVRDLSYSLRPPALQAIGLDSAIHSYIDNFSKKIETPISFKAVGITNKNIDESISINLYRILQETLNNTAKHAHAENIDIKLIYSYPFLLLKIEDDGVGFNFVKSEMKAKGREKLGLPGINERVSLLGGELIINSNKGEGTKILIKVPVESNEKV